MAERQTRPKGAPELIDEKWKKATLERMKELGITRADLARSCGVTPSAITTIFQPQTESTRLKTAIHKALGFVAIEATPAVTKEDALRRVTKRWGDLSEEQREHVARLVDMLTGKGS